MIEKIIEIFKVIFLGIVEGITEWLPISSTGHMLLVDEFIKLNMSDSFKEMFFVVIQLGAILAVVVMFWKKMFPFQFKNKEEPFIKRDIMSIWLKVVVACIPGAAITLLFDEFIGISQPKFTGTFFGYMSNVFHPNGAVVMYLWVACN